MPSTLRQGVTTVVVGQLRLLAIPAVVVGGGAVGSRTADPDERPRPTWAGWRDYLDAIDAARPAVNVATLVGHGSVRREVLGGDRRPPTAAELDRMCAIVREAVLDGRRRDVDRADLRPRASSPPTDEVIALARAAASAGGLYASHIRGEGRDLFDAVDEALAIGAAAELPVHVSHLKCETSLVWGRADDLLGRLRDAPDATGDQYPYEAWNSSLSSLLPPWAPAGQVAALAASDHDRLRPRSNEGSLTSNRRSTGSGGTTSCSRRRRNPSGVDASVAEVAEDRGIAPFDAIDRAPRRRPGDQLHRARDVAGRRAHHPVRSRHLRRVRRIGDGARRSRRRPARAPTRLRDVPPCAGARARRDAAARSRRSSAR